MCCGSVELPAGFDGSASLDASFDAASFGLTLACGSSGPAPGFQVCLASLECPTGQFCGGGPMNIGGKMSPLTACFPIDSDAEAAPPVPDAAGAGPEGDGGASAGAAADGG